MKIVVVGAGTAGWLTATAIKKQAKEIDVHIIHDPNTKTIGVGETLVWSMPRFFRDILGMDKCREWMMKTDATFKTGVEYHNIGALNQKFVNCYIPNSSLNYLKGNGSFHENIYLQEKFKDTYGLIEVWEHLKDKPEYAELLKDPSVGLSQLHYFGENNTSIISGEGDFLVHPYLGYSYHYNAEAVGTVIGDMVGKPAGIKEIASKVVQVNVHEGNISSLKLENGMDVTADIFIDCTGFKRELMKHLDFKWTACDELYNNSAIVGQRLYDNDSDHYSRKIHNRTRLFGMDNGWSFNVPTRKRSGNGYCFSSKLSPDIDKIKDEFDAFLGPRKPEENPEYRLIQWDPGYYNFMSGNCFAAGLSWGFSDPYGANNLSALTTQLMLMLTTSKNKPVCDIVQVARKVMPLSEFRDKYNKLGNQYWEMIDLRIKAVFRLSQRRDTEYWRILADAGEKEGVKEKLYEAIHEIEVNKSKSLGFALSHAYLFTKMRNGLEFPTPPVNLTKEEEQLFIKTFINNKETAKHLAENSMPIDKFYDYFYSDDFPNKDI